MTFATSTHFTTKAITFGQPISKRELDCFSFQKFNAISQLRERNFLQLQEALPEFWSQSSEASILSSFAYGTFVKDPYALHQALAANNIESRPLVCGNIGRHPFWLKSQAPFSAPIADLVHNHGIYFPNHVLLSEMDIKNIARVVSTESSPVFPHHG